MAKYISYNCYLIAESDKVNFGLKEEEILPEFYKQMIFAAFFPMVTVLSMFTMSQIIQILRGQCYIKTDIIKCYSLVSFWIFQPEICRVLFLSITCKEYEGKMRLMDDLDIICWEGTHSTMVSLVTIPAL